MTYRHGVVILALHLVREVVKELAGCLRAGDLSAEDGEILRSVENEGYGGPGTQLTRSPSP